MKKWALIATCLIFCIIILLVFAGLWNLGPLIKKAVNTYGPGITGTQVHVESVRTSLFTGEARLTNFTLGNPAGFKSPHALKVASLYCALNEESLAGNTIVINKIELIHPEINYEKVNRTDNFKQLLKNIKGSAGNQASSSDQEVKAEGSRRLIIKNVIIRDAELTIAISSLVSQSLSARLGDIHLKDIGEKEGGLPPSEAFNIILSALYGGITSSALTNILSNELKATGTTLEELGRSTTRDLKDASNSLKKLLGK